MCVYILVLVFNLSSLFTLFSEILPTLQITTTGTGTRCEKHLIFMNLLLFFHRAPGV